MGCASSKILKSIIEDIDDVNDGGDVANDDDLKKKKLVTRAKFHFGSIIGEGGFAVIREVRHILDDKWFALKENNLLKVTTDDAKVILNELTSLVRLSYGGSHHPFIIKLHLAFRDLRSTYMVLDLLTAGDLRIYLGSGEIFTEQKAAFLISCVGSALHHMHQRKIIHRDLKPENILFDSHGFPYVTDFGLSYCLPMNTKYCICDKKSGTLEYFAPEIFVPNQHYHSYESDYWSLGVILYEILFRKRPCDDPIKSLIIYSRDTYEKTWVTLNKLKDYEIMNFQKDENRSQHQHHHQLQLQQLTGGENKFDDLILEPSSSNQDLLSCYPFSTIFYYSHEFELQILEGIEINTTHFKKNLENQTENHQNPQDPQDQDPLPIELQIPIPLELFSKTPTSSSCLDLLNSLLDVRIHKRIGVDSRYSLFENHEWFHVNGINFEQLLNHQIPSPITPNLTLVADKICAKLMKTNFEDENQQISTGLTTKPLPTNEVDMMIGSFTYLSSEYTSLYLTTESIKPSQPMRNLIVRALSSRITPTNS